MLGDKKKARNDSIQKRNDWRWDLKKEKGKKGTPS